MVEGETISFPYKKISDAVKTQMYLVKEVDSQVISFMPVAPTGNRIEIKGLTEGTYYLTLNEYKRRIKLMIVKGAYWNDTHMIQTERELIDFKNRINTLIIKGVAVLHVKDGKGDVYIKLMSMDPKRTRLHLFAFNFMPKNSQSV